MYIMSTFLYFFNLNEFFDLLKGFLFDLKLFFNDVQLAWLS